MQNMKPGYRLNNILWALRKIRLPFDAGGLVLDVGSGSNPHPAADVLLEKYVDTTHRYDSMVADRPTVLADACKMPFKDKAFDFVMAFHVLEHMHEPEAFLSELQRVGKAGYIETPNAIFERLVPYDVHLLEVMEIDGVLRIHKKAAAQPDNYLNALSLTTKNAQWRKFFYANPALFHVTHVWKERIRYEVVNPDVSTAWFVDPDIELSPDAQLCSAGEKVGLRGWGLAAMRWWYRRRKRTVDLNQLLVCPECHGSLVLDENYYRCPACVSRYSRHPIPDFNKPV